MHVKSLLMGSAMAFAMAVPAHANALDIPPKEYIWPSDSATCALLTIRENGDHHYKLMHCSNGVIDASRPPIFETSQVTIRGDRIDIQDGVLNVDSAGELFGTFRIRGTFTLGPDSWPAQFKAVN